MIDVSALHKRIINGEEVSITFKFISDEFFQEIQNLLVLTLSHLDVLFLSEIISTVIKEILINSVKANSKRLFFYRMGLDIANPADYQKGMNQFLTEVTSKWEEQEDYLNRSEFYVQLLIQITNGFLSLKIKNNVSILPEELERINRRIESAKKYSDLSEAFLDLSDSQESAGLGIILIHLLLKNSGIGTHNFKISSNRFLTITDIDIPRKISPISINLKFNEKILNEIEGIPPLPNQLTRIINMCNNPETDIQSLAKEINKDPALSADLLKLSNSALFTTRNKVNNIATAVKIVGIKNIKNMLWVSGVRKIMEGRFRKIQHIWSHSNKCCYFAKKIGDSLVRNKLGDIAAVGALLHDIGKLVLLILDSEILKNLNQMIEKDIGSSVLLEELSLGISHPSIGAKLAHKWDFPKELISMIEFHHRPFLATPEHRELTEIVYLANMMVNTIEEKASYYTIDKDVLRTFKFETKEKFNQFIEKTVKEYESI